MRSLRATKLRVKGRNIKYIRLRTKELRRRATYLILRSPETIAANGGRLGIYQQTVEQFLVSLSLTSRVQLIQRERTVMVGSSSNE